MIEKMKFKYLALFTCLVVFNLYSSVNSLFAIDLAALKMQLVPYPKEVVTGGNDFNFKNELTIVLDKNPSVSDKFTADELIKDLKSELGIDAKIGSKGTLPAIVLTRLPKLKSLKSQGYQIVTSQNELVIKAKDEDGLFFGTQTLLQLIKPGDNGFKVPGLTITDWPDILERAIHYDTKHHQDKSAYVKSFIKDLSKYKVNMLVWEWEDKFAYPSHPEIGAPGAFTMKEMQEFTRYAKQYHIQIVPLVQGLGHVSYILKWPQYKNLREIEASNWEFCPLKQGSYDLLVDLWKDAIEATPGSRFIHIGSDETYELAACENCKAKAKEIGKNGLYFHFLNKSAESLKLMDRKVIAWAGTDRWAEEYSAAKGIEPNKNLVFIDFYDLAAPKLDDTNEIRKRGYKVFAYNPNPGVVPLMVPYNFERGEKGDLRIGSLEKSHNSISHAAQSGSFDGMISTSWDDVGLHNQMWMLHFVHAAASSWNGSAPSKEDIREAFFNTYYGDSSDEMGRLFKYMNDGAYHYFWGFERRVWHYGAIGKSQMPDLPRRAAVEYDQFWNIEYKDMVNQSKKVLVKMDSALLIIANNKKAGVKNKYDFELFRTNVELVKHTCLTYLDLSNLENTIKDAHVNRYVDSNVALKDLYKAQQIVENILKRRDLVYKDLVSTYEISRLPKGLSTSDKAYFWQEDRARHFANRTPDLSYLIYDDQLMDMEGYLKKLKDYIEFFKKNSMN